MDKSRTFANSRDNWRTPELFRQAVWNVVSEIGTPEIDLAASGQDALCGEYFTKEQDALKQRWPNRLGYVNPPFSMKEAFIEKAAASPGPTVMVLPADTSTEWFARLSDVAWVWFCIGRVPFVDPTTQKKSANPGGSIVALFNWPDNLISMDKWRWREWTDEAIGNV